MLIHPMFTALSMDVVDGQLQISTCYIRRIEDIGAAQLRHFFWDASKHATNKAENRYRASNLNHFDVLQFLSFAMAFYCSLQYDDIAGR